MSESTQSEISIDFQAHRDPSDPLKQFIAPEDIAAVRAAVQSQNPDLEESKVEETVSTLTTGNLAMARVTGSRGAVHIFRGVRAHVTVAPRPEAKY